MKFHFIVKDKAFYRRVLQIAVPIALQSLITIGVNMMDTIMLGSMGETQLAPPPWPTSSSTSTRSSAWAWAWGPAC